MELADLPNPGLTEKLLRDHSSFAPDVLASSHWRQMHRETVACVEEASGRKGRLKLFGRGFGNVQSCHPAQMPFEWMTSIGHCLLSKGQLDLVEAVDAGLGDAGPAVLLARALARTDKIARTVVDAAALERIASEPGASRIDAARSAAILAAPGRLVLHGLPAGTDLAPVSAAYRAAGREDALTVIPGLDRLLEDK